MIRSYIAARGNVAPFLGVHFFQESIQSRDGGGHGLEISARLSEGEHESYRFGCSQDHFSYLNAVAIRAKLMAVCLPYEKAGSTYVQSLRMFIGIEKSSLLKEEIISEIKRVVGVVGGGGGKMVLIIDAGRFESSRVDALLLNNILILKECGVEFALRTVDGFGLNALHLGIYSYLYIDVAGLELQFCAGIEEMKYQELYEKMCDVGRMYKVRFIAVNLRNHKHFVVAYAMPFDFFQIAKE